ncbi:Methyltransferase type 11 [Cynara cardunculus var. scolymus]|uniref:Methyltransferase type 11 n=1 Tax=Cynara cardunculus var. scolymus TaxID=59895 RepID=A0A103Y7D5_CYNCS|nr:Methyltransferase type 11 [Cynara cardunculus var. scolymus]
MASSMLYGAQHLAFARASSTPKGLESNRSDLQFRNLPKINLVRRNPSFRSRTLIVPKCSVSAPRSASQPRFIQHKKEAFWFYRFLSIVYDHVINPGHWTEDMRDDALEPADLNRRDLIVVDVGGGTGFTTLGIVEHVDAKNVTILDQSPHQLAKAREKEALKECKIIEGDAEELSFKTDYADRYVSAGRPTKRHQRSIPDMWMLFPKEEEYVEWFEKAGFKDVQIKRIGPKWYRGVRRHGLIMGCSVTGIKPASGDSPLEAEDVEKAVNPFVFFLRFLLGATAGVYYVLVPVYMWVKDQIVPKGEPI